MAALGSLPNAHSVPKLRLDVWLWHARICKTRSEASALVEGGHVRINAQHCLKPGHRITLDDILTLVVADRVCVLRVMGLGTRRGPAAEAHELYKVVDPDGNGSNPT